MSYAGVQDHYFKSAVDLEDITVSEIAKEYLKQVMASSVIWMIIAGVLIGYCICFSHGLPWETAVGIFGGFLEILLTIRVITGLFAAGKISKRNFTWVKGMVTGYRLYAASNPKANLYLYCVLNETYLCHMWANPMYKNGTVVYFLMVGDSEFSAQNVVVKIK